jgi:hypothetical protein
MAPALLAVVMALVIGAVAAFVGAEYERTRTPIYQSSAVLLLDNPVGITADPTFLVGVSQARAKYVGLVDTDVIAGPASQALGLPTTFVARRVRATFAGISLNIVITAKSTSPDQAQSLAGGVAKQLLAYVSKEQAGLPNIVKPELRLRMQIVSDAPLGSRLSPNHVKEERTGVIVGLVALIASYVVAQLVVDSRRRTKRRHRKRRATV